MIKPSTGLKHALLTWNLDVRNNFISNGISLGDGDGTGGLDTINASSGLDIFKQHAFVKTLTPSGDPNRNKLVKVLSSSATQLEVPAGSFTTLAAGSDIDLLEFDVAGCFRSIFQNATIRLFNESRASDADQAEPGISICDITLNAGAFVAGEPTNGLNFGDLVGNTLRRAIDPETAAPEIMRGLPKQALAANSFRLYANNVITGASVVSVRFDGSVTGQAGGGDLIMASGNQLTMGVPVDVSEVTVEISAAAVL